METSSKKKIDTKKWVIYIPLILIFIAALILFSLDSIRILYGNIIISLLLVIVTWTYTYLTLGILRQNKSHMDFSQRQHSDLINQMKIDREKAYIPRLHLWNFKRDNQNKKVSILIKNVGIGKIIKLDISAYAKVEKSSYGSLRKSLSPAQIARINSGDFSESVPCQFDFSKHYEFVAAKVTIEAEFFDVKNRRYRTVYSQDGTYKTTFPKEIEDLQKLNFE